jgi:general secretion pathway protein G
MKKLMQGFLLALLIFVVGFAVFTIIRRPYVEREAREITLKQTLLSMRKSIDQYASDNEKPAHSLNDLVKQGYIREIPPDPVTNKHDWDVEFGEVKELRHRNYGIVDVHSSSSKVSASGIPYHDF